MSLEAQIEKLNANFDKLIGLLTADKQPAINLPGKPLPPMKEAAVIDYEKHVKPAVLAFAAKNGRDALIAALKPFGIATAKDAKLDQYPALLKALTDVAA